MKRITHPSWRLGNPRYKHSGLAIAQSQQPSLPPAQQLFQGQPYARMIKLGPSEIKPLYQDGATDYQNNNSDTSISRWYLENGTATEDFVTSSPDDVFRVQGGRISSTANNSYAMIASGGNINGLKDEFTAVYVGDFDGASFSSLEEVFRAGAHFIVSINQNAFCRVEYRNSTGGNQVINSPTGISGLSGRIAVVLKVEPTRVQLWVNNSQIIDHVPPNGFATNTTGIALLSTGVYIWPTRPVFFSLCEGNNQPSAGDVETILKPALPVS